MMDIFPWQMKDFYKLSPKEARKIVQQIDLPMKEEKTKTLKQTLTELFQLTEYDFGQWQSDLYVRHTTVVEEWLKKNYEFPGNIEYFRSQIDGDRWMCIPFAYVLPVDGKHKQN